EAVANAARSHELDIRQRRAHLHERFLGRYAPVGKGGADGLALLGGALRLDGVPRGAAAAGDVDGAHAGRFQAPRGVGGDAEADLFGDDGSAELCADLGDACLQAFEIAIALRLRRFLQNVQVEDQSVRADHLDGATTLGDAVAVV